MCLETVQGNNLFLSLFHSYVHVLFAHTYAARFILWRFG